MFLTLPNQKFHLKFLGTNIVHRFINIFVTEPQLLVIKNIYYSENQKTVEILYSSFCFKSWIRPFVRRLVFGLVLTIKIEDSNVACSLQVHGELKCCMQPPSTWWTEVLHAASKYMVNWNVACSFQVHGKLKCCMQPPSTR